MQRIFIFTFLVVGLPGGIYWAGGGFDSAGDTFGRFVREVHAMGGTRPPSESEIPDEDLRPKKPEPKKPDEKENGSGKPDTKEPTDPKKPPTEPEESRIEKAQQRYDAGQFDEAARLFGADHERMHAMSALGVAFAHAFSVRVPDGVYTIINDGQFEGFATEDGNMLHLRSAGGRSLAFPKDSIRNRETLARPRALERLARQITTEGLARDLKGARLFALLQETFSLGRPDVAAPLLPRALELDEAKPFFLTSVRHRVPASFQDDLYRAFARCQVLPESGPPEAETVATQAPRNLGDGKLTKRPKRNKSSIRNAEALEFVRKAAPHRIEGKRLHKAVFLAGRDKAKLADVDKAIAELDKALDYYEKAVALEDATEIHALLRYCSKLAFQLRFWREQVAGN